MNRAISSPDARAKILSAIDQYLEHPDDYPGMFVDFGYEGERIPGHNPLQNCWYTVRVELIPCRVKSEDEILHG